MIVRLNSATHGEFIRVCCNKTIFARQASRPLTIGIYGMSGVGKSSLALYWADQILRMVGKRDMSRHLLDEHIAYKSGEALEVLSHCLYCEENIPIFISMEGREMLDSRQSMSAYNKTITQALTLSRAIRPLALIFCVQRILDVDVRVRESFNLLARVRSYITSDGRLIPPNVRYFYIERRLSWSEGVKEFGKIKPVFVVLNGHTASIGVAEWKIVDFYEVFREIDRERKEELIMSKKERDREDYTVKMVAKALGINEREVKKMVENNVIEYKKIGNKVYIPKQSVERLRSLLGER